MFELMSKMKVDTSNKEMQEYMNLIKKLDNLQSYTSLDEGIRKEMKVTADKYIKTAGLEELMRIKNEEGTTRIMVKSGAKENQIKELLMIIDGKAKGSIVDARAKGASDEATVLVSLTGDFDLNEISVLTDKMKIPGGEDLKKATKDKK
ncbi:hypothetical protein FEM08_01450 [Flavobacterium gilvum]|nr:hypothetical protein FEM08_01450 [Flavobacterium gilvum]